MRTSATHSRFSALAALLSLALTACDTPLIPVEPPESPVITALDPAEGVAGNAAFTLAVEGANFTVATAVYWLWRAPEQRELLLQNAELIPGAVEETVRYDPPSQYQGRVTTREVELHGRRMPKGARVLLLTGSSGRDERKFPAPDRYDVRRQIDLHLGFGYGQHVCLGASLARLESKIALEEILQRFPRYEVVESGIERMHSSNVRGFSGVPIRY